MAKTKETIPTRLLMFCGIWQLQIIVTLLQRLSTGAAIAVFGRIVVMSLMLLVVFSYTGYLSDGTFLIEYKDSYFAYSQMDLVMTGGCTPCHTYCKRVLHQMATFNHEALMSKPTFEDLYTATSWDYSLIGSEGLALADRLEASGAICSGGVDEVLYLAQVTYHLIYNSDLYYVGLVTGTLTVESVANLTLSFFIFSYSFINLAKARSGEQQLDRYFRLTWETMQILITMSVAILLYSIRSKSLSWIVDYNGQLLRKTTVLGKKYCGLHDSCFLMNVNLAVVVAVISSLLGLVALSASYFVQKRYGKKLSSVEAPTPSKKVAIQAKGANRYLIHNNSLPKFGKDENNQETVEDNTLPPLTTFEENCLGSPFTRLFKDCDDFATVTYMGKRCTSVEALLLTGYLFYGQHVYQAGSVVLLLLARLIPRKLLRTFNVLLIRWYMDPDNGRLTDALSCTWFAASAENYKISEATPVAEVAVLVREGREAQLLRLAVLFRLELHVQSRLQRRHVDANQHFLSLGHFRWCTSTPSECLP